MYEANFPVADSLCGTVKICILGALQVKADI